MSLGFPRLAGHIPRTLGTTKHLAHSCGCPCAQCAGGVAPCSLQITLGSAGLATSCANIYDCDPHSMTYLMAVASYRWLRDPWSGLSFCSNFTGDNQVEIVCQAGGGPFDAADSLIFADVACPVASYLGSSLTMRIGVNIVRKGEYWYGWVDLGPGLSSCTMHAGLIHSPDCFAPVTIPNLITVAAGSHCPMIDDPVLQGYLDTADVALRSLTGTIDGITIVPKIGRCAA